jgi:N-acetylglucosamine-6-phosphate deacetylase
MIAIVAKCILTPFDMIENGVILVDHGQLVAVGQEQQVAVPPDSKMIDARMLTVAPGLVDLHTHGGGGSEAIEGTPEALARLAAFYAQHGVTGFLAGVWGTNAQIEAGIDVAVAAMMPGQAPRGAAVLGVYLEGPFINPERRGAFPPDMIVAPDTRLLARYIERANGALRLLTLAPELDGAFDLIRLAAKHSVVCAAGHSAANWEQTMRAVDVGVRHVTHTYNAMNGLHHRDPGLLGAALADDRLSAEVIADGVHVHPTAVRQQAHAKQIDQAVLITDSIAAAGLPNGSHHIGELAVVVANGAATAVGRSIDQVWHTVLL